MWCVNRWVWLMGAWLVPCTVVAQTPQAESSPAPAASAASEETSGARPVDPDVVLLGELRRNIELERSRAELLGIQQQIQEAREKLGESDAGDGNTVPSLIGLYGGGSHVTAEFLVGSGASQTVLTAGVGEWVTHRWRVDRMLPNGVVLAARGGERRTVLFGRKSAPGVLGGGSAGIPARQAAAGQPGSGGAIRIPEPVSP